MSSDLSASSRPRPEARPGRLFPYVPFLCSTYASEARSPTTLPHKGAIWGCGQVLYLSNAIGIFTLGDRTVLYSRPAALEKTVAGCWQEQWGTLVGLANRTNPFWTCWH